MLDYRTIILTYTLTQYLSLIVLAMLWWGNREGIPATRDWLRYIVIQCAALTIIVLRERLPPFLAVNLASLGVMVSLDFLYAGVCTFFGQKRHEWLHRLYLIAFASVHLYFTVVVPSLNARNINYALAIAFFMLRTAAVSARVRELEVRGVARLFGAILGASALVSLSRLLIIALGLATPDVQRPGLPVTLMFLILQWLSMGMTFGLFLLVNRRLSGRLKLEVESLNQSQAALERSLAEVKTLQGLLPICAWCKKIRDDSGFWTQIEQYVSNHTEVQFSHGVCPDCARAESERFRKGQEHRL